jgi:hypothetical protein
MSEIRFDGPIVEIPREELLLAFKDILEWDDSGAAIDGLADVTRAIILNELEFPSDTAIRDERDIWYASVKPIFSKLGMLRKPLSSGSTDQAFLKGRTDLLQKYVAQYVREGLFTYRQLGIIDHSRDKHHCAAAESYEESSGYAVAFGMFPWLVLATEKDTQFAELSRIAQLYGCSAISGSGQCAFAATERLIDGIMAEFLERVKVGAPAAKWIEFLAFTDYDGAGFSIAETFATQARYCLKNLSKSTGEKTFEKIPVHISRLGINLDQMSEKEVEDNKYQMPENAINKKWFERTGGIGGELYGLELNAMKHARRVKIITDGLNERIPIDIFKKLVRGSYIRKIALGACHELIETALEMTVARERDNVAEPEITTDSLQSLAIEGAAEFPIECDGNREGAIASVMISELREALLQED